MTASWIPCNDGFIEADVIRWREPVWEKRGPKGGRVVKVGDRDMVAQVVKEDPPDEREDSGWVWLLVKSCKIAGDTQGRKSTGIDAESTVKRARKTIDKGYPERLPWSDESARARVLAEWQAARPAKGRARKPGKRKKR